MRRSLPLSKAPLASRGCSLGGMAGLLTGSDSRWQRIAFLKIFGSVTEGSGNPEQLPRSD